MNSVPLTHILFVSTALFFIGMYGLFTRRNMISLLMSIELILNSVNINFVAFNKYLYPDQQISISAFNKTVHGKHQRYGYANAESHGTWLPASV